MTVIGTKKGSFKDRQSGESVSYGRVYVVYDFPANYDGTAQTGCGPYVRGIEGSC